MRDSMIFYRSFYEAINELPNEIPQEESVPEEQIVDKVHDDDINGSK